jgi:hypothetical protein
LPETQADARYERPLHVAHVQHVSAQSLSVLHVAPTGAPFRGVPQPHESSLAEYESPDPPAPSETDLPPHDEPHDESAVLDDEQPTMNVNAQKKTRIEARIDRQCRIARRLRHGSGIALGHFV